MVYWVPELRVDDQNTECTSTQISVAICVLTIANIITCRIVTAVIYFIHGNKIKIQQFGWQHIVFFVGLLSKHYDGKHFSTACIKVITALNTFVQHFSKQKKPNVCQRFKKVYLPTFFNFDQNRTRAKRIKIISHVHACTILTMSCCVLSSLPQTKCL